MTSLDLHSSLRTDTRLTAELRQAIELLALSHDELQARIDDMLSHNVLLEAAPTQTDDARDDSEEAEYFDAYSAKSTNTLNFEEVPPLSLHDHLYDQMALIRMSDRQRSLCWALIDAIDDDGYLRVDFAELSGMLTVQLADPVAEQDLESALRLIQNCDPSGVGARSVAECLQLQLREQALSPELQALSSELINHHLETLAQGHWTELTKTLATDQATLQTAIKIIKNLAPYPGHRYGAHLATPIIPDVIVRKIGARFHALLNEATHPPLRLNDDYLHAMSEATTANDRQFFQQQRQEAHWFLRSLAERKRHLQQVADYLVAHQHAFFEHGALAMQPLRMRDLADKLSLHPSTITRICQQKFLTCQQGTFAFKYFFNIAVANTQGINCSSTQIRALIKVWITNEDKDRPLGDQAITDALAQQGLKVARRTVAKYREALAIAPMHERKRQYSLETII